MRTLTASAIILAATLSVSACGSDGEPSVNGPASPSSGSPAPSSSATDPSSSSGSAGESASSSPASGSSSTSSSSSASSTGGSSASGDKYTSASGAFTVTAAKARKDSGKNELDLSAQDGTWMLDVVGMDTAGQPVLDATASSACTQAASKNNLTKKDGQTATVAGEAAKGCVVYGKGKNGDAAVWILAVQHGGKGYVVSVGGRGSLTEAQKLRDTLLGGWAWVK